MRFGTRQWGPVAVLAAAAVSMTAAVGVTGCGAGVRVANATSSSAAVSQLPANGAVRTITDHTLRLTVPTGWEQRDRTSRVAQEDLASIVLWSQGGTGQTPADVILVHETDTAPRPGADVSKQRERDLIGQGLQVYAADPTRIQAFAQSRGHGCFTAFQPVGRPARWEQGGLIGLQFEWTCVAEVPAHGWAAIAFDPAGVKHRVTVTAPLAQWDAHRGEIDAVRRSLRATAMAPSVGG